MMFDLTQLQMIFFITFLTTLLPSLSAQLIHSQYLGCYFESIDLHAVAQKGLFAQVNFDVDQCSRYCYMLDQVTFGITDQGVCVCSDSNYDIFGADDTYLCHNPCSGHFIYPGFHCGGNFIYVSFYRTCPIFTYGASCTQFCFCRTTICQPISGKCLGMGCVEGFEDTSSSIRYSYCFLKNCSLLNGDCLTYCETDAFSPVLLEQSCNCSDGYYFRIKTFSCDDINECILNFTSNCDTCENTLGSYKCLCDSGEEAVVIDSWQHCLVPNRFNDLCHKCHSEQECVLTQDDVLCVCPFGEEVIGECYSKSLCENLPFCHICQQKNNTAECTCMTGYTLVSESVCYDTNECNRGEECEDCINFPGSYFCQCEIGCSCKNYTRVCSMLASNLSNLHYLGGTESSFNLSPLLYGTNVRIGIFYNVKLTILYQTSFQWKIVKPAKYQMRKISVGPVVYYNLKHLYHASMQFEAAFMHTNNVSTKTSLYTNIIRPTTSKFLTPPVQHIYYNSSVVLVMETLSHEVIGVHWISKERNLPCHYIDKDYNKSDQKSLNSDVLHFNISTTGINLKNFSNYIHFNQPDYQQFSIYSKGYSISNTISFCEMVTFVVENPKRTLRRIKCVSNCRETLDLTIDLQLEFETNQTVKDYLFFWNLTDNDNSFINYGVGETKFLINASYFSSLRNLRQKVTLKKTHLNITSDSNVYTYAFKKHLMYSESPCNITIRSPTQLREHNLIVSAESSMDITCKPAAGVKTLFFDIFFGNCYSDEEMIWLYRHDNGNKFTKHKVYLFTYTSALHVQCIYVIEMMKNPKFTYYYKFYVHVHSNLPKETWMESQIDEMLLATHVNCTELIVFTQNFNLLINNDYKNFELSTASYRKEMTKNFFTVIKKTLKQLKNQPHTLYTILWCLVSITNHRQQLEPSDLEGVHKDIKTLLKRAIVNESMEHVSSFKSASVGAFLQLYAEYLSNYVWVSIQVMEKERMKKNTGFEIREFRNVEEYVDEMFECIRHTSWYNHVFKSNYADYLIFLHNSSLSNDSMQLKYMSELGTNIYFKKPADEFSVKFIVYKVFIMRDHSVNVYMRPISIDFIDQQLGPNDTLKIDFLVDSDNVGSTLYESNHYAPMIAIKTNTLTVGLSSRFQLILSVTLSDKEKKVNNVDLLFYLCPPFILYFTFQEFNSWCHLSYKSKLLFSKEGTDDSSFSLEYVPRVGNQLILVIFLENLLGLIDIKVALTVDKLSCLTKDSGILWSNETCKILNKGMVTKNLLCHCNQSKMYVGYMVTLPVKLYLKYEDNSNSTGFVIMAFFWVVFIAVIVYAFINDFANCLINVPIDLADNPPKGQFVYLMVVETGSMMNMGTLSEVFLKLSGSNGESITCSLSCNAFPVLQRGHANHFIIRCVINLGHILLIRVWHRGVDQASNWFLNNIKIIDLQTQMTYYFLCQSWVGTNNEEWRSSLVSVLLTQEEFHSREFLLPHNTLRLFQFRHRITSIFLMTSNKTLTRMDRTVLILFLVLFTLMASSYMTESRSSMKDYYTSYFGVNVFKYRAAFMIVLVLLPVAYLVEYILTSLKWSLGQLLIIKDSCLLNKTMLEEGEVDFTKVPWRIRQKVLRPIFEVTKSEMYRHQNANKNAKAYDTKKFIKLLFVYKLFSPGFLSIFIICIVLSIFLSYHLNNMRYDYAYMSRLIFRVSLIFFFVICGSLFHLFEILFYTFVLKKEIVSCRYDISKLYITCRQEYRSAFILEESSVLKRRSFLDYTIPKRNQFLPYTKKNKFHWLVNRMREADFLLTWLLAFILMRAETYNVSGIHSGVADTNLNLIRTLNPYDASTKLLFKEDCWDWVRNVTYDEMFGEVIHQEEIQKRSTNVQTIYVSKETTSNTTTTTALPSPATSSTDADADEVAIFSECLRTRNTDVCLITPICFWRVDGATENFKMTYGDSITPSIDHVCTSFTKQDTLDTLTHVVRNSWLHRKIVGISVKFFLYTSNVNVYSIVTLGCQSDPGKVVKGYFKVNSANLYHSDNAHIRFIFFFIIMLLLVASSITFLFKLYQNGIYVYITRFRYLVHCCLVASGFFFLLTFFLKVSHTHHISHYYQFSLEISYFVTFTQVNHFAFFLFYISCLIKLFLFATYHLKLSKHYWNDAYTEHLMFVMFAFSIVYFSLSKVFMIFFAEKKAFRTFWTALVNLVFIPVKKNSLSSQIDNLYDSFYFCPLFLAYLALFVAMRHLAFAFLCFRKIWRDVKE